MQYCNAVSYGSQPRPGEVCQALTGTCADEAIEPVPVCCQQTLTTCFQQSAGSVAQIRYDQYCCLAGAGIGAGPPNIVVNGTCGADGVCVHE